MGGGGVRDLVRAGRGVEVVGESIRKMVGGGCVQVEGKSWWGVV